ncbi:DUF1194 domain-containing protein [Rhodospirillum centenum]|uniref:VWFA domain-containing protein n=1 Tax=Rhodospirillum centenum (strain ATCC 51521 / SW) TaxID=414684 RepID=B6IWZ2_RHOCS|nr:DUF1194 domain-containing protein [Rhodospirillum centenum]ACJ00816.1 conserved hypothetical protein [Rhodospirillum centenum SW]
MQVPRVRPGLRRVLAAVLLVALGTLVAVLPAGASRAQELPVDLELVLLVDVSGSVDAQEAELQRRGYADALMSDQVVEAIRSGPLGRIAVTYVEWADDTYQVVVVGWTVLDGPESARAFAERLTAAPVTTAFWTAIGSALDFATRQFDGNGAEGTRRVIDISGDGYSNRGRPPAEARDAAVAAGITINGLPILNSRPNPWGGLPPLDLDSYYQTHVIGGPGAFILVAEDFPAFGEAILAKLVKEIAQAPGPAPGSRLAGGVPEAAGQNGAAAAR